MTENEAKQNIIAYASMEAENLPIGMGITFDTAIKALEELQQYRALGTVEKLTDNMEELKRWHTDKIAPNVKNPFAYTSTLICHNCDHKDDYIEELEAEVAEYREIGEISTCRNAVEICRAMIERGIEPENIEAYIAFEDKCVQKGFTIKGLLEAGEKQTAQKVKNSGERVPFEWYCPTCGSILCDDGYKDTEIAFCENCGQKLDWEQEGER